MAAAVIDGLGGRSLDEHLAILQTLLEDEATYRPAHNYVAEGASVLQPWMRRDVVDWLVEVAAHYKFHPETLGLAVNYMDRYCAQQSVAVRHFQLVGVTALLLAAKMRELAAPNLHQLAELCCGAAERSDIKLMERLYCFHLDWRLDAITPHVLLYFLLPVCRLSDAAHATLRQHSELLLEVALPSPLAVTAPASLLALATIICSLAALRLLRPSTAEPLLAVSGARLDVLEQYCDHLVALFAEAFPSEPIGPMQLYRPLLRAAAYDVVVRPAKAGQAARDDDVDGEPAQLVPEWIGA